MPRFLIFLLQILLLIGYKMNSVIERPTENNRCSFNCRIFCRTQAHLLKKRISLLVSGIIAIVYITGCGPPSLDTKSMQALFEDRKQPFFDNYAVDDRLIHYPRFNHPENCSSFFYMVHPVRGTIGPNIWQMKTSRQRPISLLSIDLVSASPRPTELYPLFKNKPNI